ncbi:MAG: DUF4157 domain-containing protein [Pseudonocardiaceae bacterium]
MRAAASHEREADRVTDRVLRTFAPPAVQSGGANSGSVLNAGTFVASFGHDFGQVRVQSHDIANARAPRAVRSSFGTGPTIGRVDDPVEAEADRLAQQMATGPIPSGATGQGTSAHPHTGDSASEQSDSRRSLPGVGRKLPDLLRFEMEQRLGFDLGCVRVHSDDQAGRLASGVGAAAFTIGHDIAFGEGRYAPETTQGRRLIAHELVHVLQQSKGRGVSPPQRRPVGRGAGVAPLWGAIQPDAASVIRRVPLEGLSAEHDLAQERIRARDRGPGTEPGPGLPFEVLKQAGYDVLIEQARALRLGFVESLRERCALLPAALQPVAQFAVDVVDADLAVILHMLFLDLGIVVGIGEGIAGMIFGIMPLVVVIVEVAFHYLLAAIYAVQQQLAGLGLTSEPSYDLIKPGADDLDALAKLWHDICYFDLFAYLDGWRTRFEQASSEQKMIMAGEFIGELATFVATWQASSAKIGRLQLPRLPPPTAAPQMAAELAGGGAMAIPVAAEASAVGVQVGGPIGGLGILVTNMASRSRDDDDRRNRELTDKETDFPTRQSRASSAVQSLSEQATDALRRAEQMPVGAEREAVTLTAQAIGKALRQLQSEIQGARSIEEIAELESWESRVRTRLRDLETKLPEVEPLPKPTASVAQPFTAQEALAQLQKRPLYTEIKEDSPNRTWSAAFGEELRSDNPIETRKKLLVSGTRPGYPTVTEEVSVSYNHETGTFEDMHFSSGKGPRH